MTNHDSSEKSCLPSDMDLFALAIELNGEEEQRQFLRSNCLGDIEQQDRVFALVESHVRLSSGPRSSVLDRPDDAFQLLVSNEDLTGTCIGTFELIKLLGEGGMGSVYLAEQHTPIQRRVAIKVIKPGMDSPALLSRFEFERQTLASLAHPSITHIIDAGVTEFGQPYFIMELAEGEALTLCCNQNRTSLRERIRLVIDVCEAIHHAHQRGIIHRDIKPSNIIARKVDDHYQVKVIDFGIAKAQTDLGGTVSKGAGIEEVLGTPLYMSPEQMSGDASLVDVRSDVYSIGAVLYELLTGTTPIAPAVLSNNRRLGIAMSDQAVKCVVPSKRVTEKGVQIPLFVESGTSSLTELQGFLKGELDWVIMKAVAVHRHERYQSVLDLQRELVRFLAGLPVEAAGERSLYRISKFIHRYRALTGLGAVTVLMCICFSIVTSLLYFSASSSEQKAQNRLVKVLKAQEDLKRERDRAELVATNSRTLAQCFILSHVELRAARIYFSQNAELFEEVNRSYIEQTEASADLVPQEPIDEITGIFMVLKSNLTSIDGRMGVQGTSGWFTDILEDSGVSFKDSIRVFREPITGVTVFEKNKHGPDNNALQANPVARPFSFPAEAEIEYRKTFLKEICGTFDKRSRFIADAYDSLGLVLLDSQIFSEAQECFEKSLRVRETDSSQLLAGLQTKLFLASVLKAQDLRSAAEVLTSDVARQIDGADIAEDVITGLRGLILKLRD